MPTNIELDNDAKKVALENSIRNTSSEIFSLCLHVNIDPEQIDIDDPEASFPEGLTEANPYFHTYRRIVAACASNKMATEKLALLNNQG